MEPHGLASKNVVAPDRILGDRDAGKNDEAAGRKDPLAVIRGPGQSGQGR